MLSKDAACRNLPATADTATTWTALTRPDPIRGGG
jgi:hypothetical protein